MKTIQFITTKKGIYKIEFQPQKQLKFLATMLKIACKAIQKKLTSFCRKFLQQLRIDADAKSFVTNVFYTYGKSQKNHTRNRTH